MKTFLLLCIFTVSSYALSAQWLWGRSNDAGFTGITEAAPLALDANGNSFIAGFYFIGSPFTVGPYAISSALGTAYIVKCNPDGNVLWMDSVGDVTTNILGMVADPGGDLYVMGQYYGPSLTLSGLTINNDSMELEDFIAKYDENGTPIWAKNIASLRSSGYIFGSLSLDEAGNVYAAGAYRGISANIDGHIITNTTTSGDSSDVFVIKYRPGGAVVWAKGFGSSLDDHAVSVSVNPTGCLYVLGNFSALTAHIGNDTLLGALYQKTPFIVKLDTNGNINWAKNVHSHLYPNDLKADKLGNFFIAGYIDSTVISGTDTLVNVGNHSSFLVMYDADGNDIWGRAANATSGLYCSATSIALDSCNVWVCGATSGNVNFNGTIVDTPTVNTDNVFIAHYNHCGKFLDGQQLPSGGEDALQIATDNKANLFLATDYAGVPMHFQQNDLPQPYTNTEFLLLAKYNYGQIVCDTLPCNDTGVTAGVSNITANELRIYPNPASESFTISSATPISDAYLQVFNVSGSIVLHQAMTGNINTISLAGWKPGIYQCIVTTKEGKRLIKRLSVL